MLRSEETDAIFRRSIKASRPTSSHGEGVYLFDTQGKRYLDACAGVHVVIIGHGVEEIAEAMKEQASKTTFTHSHFLSKPQSKLARKIADIAPGDLSRVFFISGGSEATESAIKIARKYHLETGNPPKFQVISRWQSW